VKPGFLDRLFPDGAALFYRGSFNQAPFTKQWTVFDKEIDRGFQFSFYLELDPKPLGQGTTIHRQRCRLLLDHELRPLGYLSEAEGVRFGLSVDGARAQALFPEGSRVDVNLGQARNIVEANITGLDAIMFAMAHDRGELANLDIRLFLINQLLEIPYRLTHGEGTHYTSSYEERLEIDEHGVLLSTEVTKAAVRFTREVAPELPAWANLPDGTRSQEQLKYVPPAEATFRQTNVSIATKRGESGGTITVPPGDGPFPAVLFLSGTGTHDRHGMSGNIDLGTHEIVDKLSECGFVGLRFDTRGAGTTRLGDAALDSSLTPLIEDARAWFGYLANHKAVDPTQIILVGHSQGGTIALLLGAEPACVASAIVLLATPGRSLHEILEEQIKARANEVGLAQDARDKQLAEFRELIAAVRSGAAFEPGRVPDHLIPMARSVAWYRDHLDIDPVDLVKRLHCRLLICQGAKDFQISTRDSERLAGGARAAGLAVESIVFPDLDHLFKHTAGTSKLEQYYDTSRHVDVAFLDRLVGWLRS
jgi:dienelactone hydrolase